MADKSVTLPYSPTQPFWAGGSPTAWIVYFHREPDYFPGDVDNINIMVFDPKAFPGGETHASILACEMADSLNKAFLVAHTAKLKGGGLVTAFNALNGGPSHLDETAV
jgi:hypothetical protein